jgi:hypothetical protein
MVDTELYNEQATYFQIRKASFKPESIHFGQSDHAGRVMAPSNSVAKSTVMINLQLQAW